MFQSIILSAIIMLLTFPCVSNDRLTPDSLYKIKQGIVTVSNKLITAIYSYDSEKEITGTGFIVDKINGLIVTNKHLASDRRVSEIKVSFFNGREIDAKILYTDPWVDFAILKVDEIPSNAIELPLCDDCLKNEENIIIVGSNEGNNFSIHTGIVSNIYESQGEFPYQNAVISLNVRGGSSGSPIINERNQVVALNFAGDNTYALVIPISYVKDALEYITKGQTPPRQDIGAIVKYYSLDNAKTFLNLEETKVDEYVKKYPDAFNKALRVHSLIERDTNLKIGDIILKANSIEIGPNFYLFQKILNTCKNDHVILDIYRDGKNEQIKTPLYSLHSLRPKKTVLFGGASFVEVDDFLQIASGAEKNQVFITDVVPGSSFDVLPWVNITNYGTVYLISVESIDGKKINSIDDIINMIPSLIKNKDFKMNVRNYAFSNGFNDMPYFNRGEFEVEIRYNSPISEPTLLYYNYSKLDWVSEKIR